MSNGIVSSQVSDRLQQELFEKLQSRMKRAGVANELLKVLAEDILSPEKLANYPIEVKLRAYQILSGEEAQTFDIARRLDLERLFPVLESMEIFRQLVSMTPEQRGYVKAQLKIAMAPKIIAEDGAEE